MRVPARWLSGLAIGLLVLLAGCGVLPSESQVDPCVSSSAVFRDDFDQQNVCGWALYNSGSESADIADGVLRMRVSTNGVVAWSNPGRSFGDGEIIVQTRQVSGPNNNAYGVICRYQDEDNFYLFLISGDGYYAIGKYVSGISGIQYLTGSAPNHYLASEFINQGAAVNQLRVRCVGDQLALYVNGLLLDEVRDADLTQGDVGLAVSTLEPGPVLVEFDNLQVTTP